MDRALRLSLLIAGLGGLVLRIAILAGPLGELDADEAVTALMAERFLDFKPALFYWGQQYGGSLDPMLTAPVVAITGSTVWAVKLVMIAMHALACLLVWRIGRRLFGERAGLVAAAVAWVFSPAVVWWSTKTRGFYGSSLVLALLTMLIVTRMTSRSAATDLPGDRDDLIAVGFVVGLAWWTSPVTLFAVVPTVLVGLAMRHDLWKRVPVAIVPFLIGGLPWWVFNLSHGFSSVEAPTAATTDYVERVDRLVTVMAPMLTGLRQPFSGEWTVGRAAGTLGLVALVAAAWTLRRRSPLPLAVIVAYPLIAAVSATSEYVGEPRYGYLLAPVIALVVGAVAARHRLLAVAAPVVLLVTTSVGVVSLADLGEQRRLSNYDLAPASTEPLVAELEGRGIETLYAEYWLAYRLTFQSDLVAAPTSASRDLVIEEAVESAPGPPPVAFYRDSDSLRRFVNTFGADTFDVVELEYYVVFYPR